MVGKDYAAVQHRLNLLYQGTRAAVSAASAGIGGAMPQDGIRDGARWLIQRYSGRHLLPR